MRFSRTHGIRGLGEFFWDDSFSTDFPDYYFDSPLVEVSAPDGEFTGQTEVLEYNGPTDYGSNPDYAAIIKEQSHFGYTEPVEPSGGSSIYSGTTRPLATLGQDAPDYEADEVAARAGNGQPDLENPYYPFAAPIEERRASEFRASYGDSRAGQSTFIKDAVTAIPAAFKAITDYDLARMRLEIEKARTMPGRPLPTLGGKAVSSVRPDPANPKMQLVTYADGSMARVPVASAGGGGWQTPALLALGAAGLFLLLRRR